MLTDKKITPVSFWITYSKSYSKKIQNENEFQQNLKKIGECNTIDEFWSFFQHLKKPSEIENVEISAFKKGIKPMWEDPMNAAGGKFSVCLSKTYCNLIWEETLFAFLGQILPSQEQITGIVISAKGGTFYLQIWIKDQSSVKVNTMKGEIAKFLQVPRDCEIEFMSFKKKIVRSNKSESEVKKTYSNN